MEPMEMKIRKVGRSLAAIFLLAVPSTSIVWAVSEEVKTGSMDAKAEEEVVALVKLPNPGVVWAAQRQACRQAVQAQEVESRQGQKDPAKGEQEQVEILVQDRGICSFPGWTLTWREEMRRLRHSEKIWSLKEIQNPKSETRN